MLPISSTITPQQLKSAQDILKVAIILVRQGREMEPLRVSQNENDMKKCGELMRQRQAIVKNLQEQAKAFPKTEFRTVPLVYALPNIEFCVSCSESTAKRSCDSAARDLQDAEKTLKQ